MEAACRTAVGTVQPSAPTEEDLTAGGLRHCFFLLYDLLRGRLYERFSPISNFSRAEKSFQSCGQRVAKIELRLLEKSFNPVGRAELAGIFVSAKRAEKIHLITRQNIYPG